MDKEVEGVHVKVEGVAQAASDSEWDRAHLGEGACSRSSSDSSTKLAQKIEAMCVFGGGRMSSSIAAAAKVVAGQVNSHIVQQVPLMSEAVLSTAPSSKHTPKITSV